MERKTLGGAVSGYVRQNVVGFVALFVALGGGAYATHTHKMGTQDLQNRAVTAPKMANNAVTPRAIRNNAVRPRMIVNNAVRTRHIFEGAITTPLIADGAVTGAKLAPGVAVSGPQGPQGEQGEQGPPGPSTGPAGGDLTGNYPNPLIADGAVSTAKIALGANGVALAAVNVDGSNGNVRSFFNRLGGEPTVNRTEAGRYVISIPGFSIPEPNAAQNVIHMANPSRIDGDRTATVFATGANPAVRTRDTGTGNAPADANFIYVLYGVFGP
jgi:hypothetical protein